MQITTSEQQSQIIADKLFQQVQEGFPNFKGTNTFEEIFNETLRKSIYARNTEVVVGKVDRKDCKVIVITRQKSTYSVYRFFTVTTKESGKWVVSYDLIEKTAEDVFRKLLNVTDDE